MKRKPYRPDLAIRWHRANFSFCLGLTVPTMPTARRERHQLRTFGQSLPLQPGLRT